VPPAADEIPIFVDAGGVLDELQGCDILEVELVDVTRELGRVVEAARASSVDFQEILRLPPPMRWNASAFPCAMPCVCSTPRTFPMPCSMRSW